MAILHKNSVDKPDRGRRQPSMPIGWINLIALAIFVVFSIVYLATRTTYNTFDAVSYSNQIAHLYVRTGDPHWLFHPHHLLFNATGYVLWRLARAFGYMGGPLVVLETFNAIV